MAFGPGCIPRTTMVGRLCREVPCQADCQFVFGDSVQRCSSLKSELWVSWLKSSQNHLPFVATGPWPASLTISMVPGGIPHAATARSTVSQGISLRGGHIVIAALCSTHDLWRERFLVVKMIDCSQCGMASKRMSLRSATSLELSCSPRNSHARPGFSR